MRKRTGGLVLGLLVLTGCGDDLGDGPPDGDPGINPGDVVGSGSDDSASLPGELDQRVIEAVAPTSGDSMASSRWLRDELRQLDLQVARGCLEDRDRLDLLDAEQVAYDFDNFEGSDPFLYPEPEILVREGLGGGPALPAELADGYGTPGSDLEIILACHEEMYDESASTEVRDLSRAIGQDWAQLVDEVQRSEELHPFYEAFSGCLEAEGVPAEDASSPYHFILWAEGQRMALVDDAEVQVGLEQAELYVGCGRESELFTRRAELFEAERDGFVEQHRDQIDELGVLITDVGVG